MTDHERTILEQVEALCGMYGVAYEVGDCLNMLIRVIREEVKYIKRTEGGWSADALNLSHANAYAASEKMRGLIQQHLTQLLEEKNDQEE